MVPGKKTALSRRSWEWLRVEAGRWQDEGLISAEQRDSILGLYPVPAGGRGAVIAALTVLGALLVGLGVILFIAHNWRAIPDWVKLAGIIALVASAHSGGYYLWHFRDYPRLGHSLILLGCLLFGAGIWLVAQTFHLQVHWPYGLLAWGLGSFPVALILRSRPVLCLSAVLLALWFIFDQSITRQVNWFYPPAAALLVLPAAHRFRAPESLWLGFVSLGAWVGLVPLLQARHFSYAAPVFIPLCFGLYGAALVAAGLWRQQRFPGAALEGPYQFAGTLIFLTGAILANVDTIRRIDPAYPGFTFNFILALFLTAAVLVFAALVFLGKPDRLDGIAARLLGAAAAGSALLLYVNLIPRVPATALLFKIWGSAFVIAAALGVVVWGFRRQAAFLINIGLLAFGVQVLLIYFRLFFTMLQGSLFFITGGLVLLGLGFFLERWRRRLLKGGGPA